MTTRFTLPIEPDLKLDPVEARAAGELLREEFQQAEPFPSIVLEDFLPDALLAQCMAGFPEAALKSDGRFNMGYAGLHKRQIMPEECDRQTQEIFWLFNSRGMLQFLEGLTGIEGLMPDPYFLGGGYHETTAGGLLGVHADFRIHQQLNVQRRLNLIIYLNKEWSDDWQGLLELWNRDMTRCVKRISPIANRCVVFQTDADTWHGHPDPLATPEGVSRRSIALYYYTASKAIHAEIPGKNTVYVARESDSAAVQREARRLRAWESLRDWVPPVAFRKLTSLRYRIEARLRRP